MTKVLFKVGKFLFIRNLHDQLLMKKNKRIDNFNFMFEKYASDFLFNQDNVLHRLLSYYTKSISFKKETNFIYNL